MNEQDFTVLINKIRTLREANGAHLYTPNPKKKSVYTYDFEIDKAEKE